MKERINEELSIAKDVSDAVEYICADLEAQYADKFDRYKSVRMVCANDDLCFMIEECRFGCAIELCGVPIGVIIRITKLPDMENYNMLYQYLNRANFFNFSTKQLFVSSIVVGDGQPTNQYFRRLLQHELNHAYQDIITNKNLFSGIYKTASDILQDESVPDVSFEKMFASAVYYFSNIEVDAEVNGLYAELQRLLKIDGSISDIKETNYYIGKMENIENFKNVIDYLQNIDNEKAKKILIPYGFRNVRHALSYLNNGYKRMKEKEMKIIALIKTKKNLEEATLFLSPWWKSKKMLLK